MDKQEVNLNDEYIELALKKRGRSPVPGAAELDVAQKAVCDDDVHSPTSSSSSLQVEVLSGQKRKAEASSDIGHYDAMISTSSSSSSQVVASPEHIPELPSIIGIIQNILESVTPIIPMFVFKFPQRKSLSMTRASTIFVHQAMCMWIRRK